MYFYCFLSLNKELSWDSATSSNYTNKVTTNIKAYDSTYSPNHLHIGKEYNATLLRQKYSILA